MGRDLQAIIFSSPVTGIDKISSWFDETVIAKLKTVADLRRNNFDYVILGAIIGPKGSGKTTLASALAYDLGLSVAKIQCELIPEVETAFSEWMDNIFVSAVHSDVIVIFENASVFEELGLKIESMMLRRHMQSYMGKAIFVFEFETKENMEFIGEDLFTFVIKTRHLSSAIVKQIISSHKDLKLRPYLVDYLCKVFSGKSVRTLSAFLRTAYVVANNKKGMENLTEEDILKILCLKERVFSDL